MPDDVVGVGNIAQSLFHVLGVGSVAFGTEDRENSLRQTRHKFPFVLLVNEFRQYVSAYFLLSIISVAAASIGSS